MYYRTLDPRTKFNFLEVHHYFTGYLISLVGFWALFNWNLIFADITIGLGIWIIADDWFQHRKQRKEIKKLGFYLSASFWHWFPYLILYKITKNPTYLSEF